MATPPSKLRTLIPSFVALLTIACFLPALSGSFLSWDDNVNFQENPAFRGFGADQIRGALTSTLFGHYIPLTRLSWSLNYALGRLNPWGYHLVNVLLHAGNALAFYAVTRRLLAAAVAGGGQEARTRIDLSVAAAVAALVFSLHPLRAEPVAWVTGRADVLCGAFVLVATWLYLRAVDGAEPARPRLVLAAGAALAAAILSKGVALPLPVALLLLDVYPLRRLARVGAWSLVREKIPLFVTSLAGGIVVGLAVRHGALLTRSEEYGVVARVATAAYCFCIYAVRFIWPAALSPLYEMPAQVRLSEPRFGLAVLACLLVTAALILLRRRWPGGLAGWAFSIIMLAPTSLALRLGADLAPDRYSYISGMGFAMLVGGMVVGLAAAFRVARPDRRALSFGVGAAILVATGALAVVTWNQVKIWRDDESLWRRAVRLDPTSPSAVSNLGSALRAQGRLDEAAESSGRALRLRPGFPEAHLNLALIRAQQGRPAEAEQHFRRALELKPRSVPAHLGLASTLEGQGRVDEAFGHFRTAIELEPRSAGPHNDLGVALARGGRLADALVEFREAVRLDPGSAQAQNNLGLALVQTGSAAEAVTHFQAAVGAKPDFREARQNLERAQRLLGR
ncbi:MAG TPA: tetratricopeptide repeat protein [Candidatus Dormibacteraeota bacterium]|nr:tetratricopeptide repeat protein [Candidatus Dormibacteraeota bacterium]